MRPQSQPGAPAAHLRHFGLENFSRQCFTMEARLRGLLSTPTPGASKQLISEATSTEAGFDSLGRALASELSRPQHPIRVQQITDFLAEISSTSITPPALAELLQALLSAWTSLPESSLACLEVFVRSCGAKMQVISTRTLLPFFEMASTVLSPAQMSLINQLLTWASLDDLPLEVSVS